MLDADLDIDYSLLDIGYSFLKTPRMTNHAGLCCGEKEYDFTFVMPDDLKKKSFVPFVTLWFCFIYNRTIQDMRKAS